MGTLLLIRHGRTQANVEGVLAGRTPGVMLDSVGIASAEALGHRLGELSIACAITSPLERTRQTSELVFGDRVPVVSEHRLLECDYGTWTNQPISELATKDLWTEVQQRPASVTFPKGEAMQAMADRAISAIREWDRKLTEEHGANVMWAAISHGDVIKAICADAMGLPLNNFQQISVDPASVSVLHYGEDRSRVVKLNDTGSDWVTQLAKRDSNSTVGGESGREQD